MLRIDGYLQWQYSSGGTAPWQDMAYASSALPVSQLQFYEFNSDANTDVFASLYDNGINVYQWMYSPGGIESFVNLKSSRFYPDRLALGDFNGDGKTDLVFNSTCQKVNIIDPTCTISDASYVYTALSAGPGSFTLSALQTYGASGWGDYPVSSDLVGDMNGDGRTDLV